MIIKFVTFGLDLSRCLSQMHQWCCIISFLQEEKRISLLCIGFDRISLQNTISGGILEFLDMKIIMWEWSKIVRQHWYLGLEVQIIIQVWRLPDCYLGTGKIRKK